MRVRPKLFAGVALDERVRSACAGVSARLQAQNFDAVYEAPEKLHLTMAFLGYVDAGQTPAILDAFQQCAAAIAPFSIDLDKLGAFPNERNPHVIWIGARDQTPFRNAALAVRAALEPLGFEFGKAPVAHVTTRAPAPTAYIFLCSRSNRYACTCARLRCSNRCRINERRATRSSRARRWVLNRRSS